MTISVDSKASSNTLFFSCIGKIQGTSNLQALVLTPLSFQSGSIFEAMVAGRTAVISGYNRYNKYFGIEISLMGLSASLRDMTHMFSIAKNNNKGLGTGRRALGQF